jgi:flagellar biosynthetic protein FlhB
MPPSLTPPGRFRQPFLKRHRLRWAVLPVLAAIILSPLLAPMLLSGWVFAPQIAQADLTRAHPFKPIARLFSAESLFDGSLALMKQALAAAAVGWALTSDWPGLQSLGDSGTSVALDASAAWVGRGVLALAALALARRWMRAGAGGAICAATR